METSVNRDSIRQISVPLSRRRAAALIAGTAAATAFGSFSARAQSHTLKLGYILAQESQLGAGATAFATDLSNATQGRLKVEQFPNSALGGEVEMLKGVQLGAIDLAFITCAPLPNIIPEVGVFNIPFLFRDASHAHAALDSAIGQSYLEKFRSKDLVALAWGENGMRHITNSKRAIKGPEDLKGLKLRLPQSEVMLAGFKALGADVAPLAFPQLYDALKTGQFDGQENPIATIVASKFSQVQKYLTLSGHVYDPAVIVMSADAFDELSSPDREAVVKAAKIGAKTSRVYAADAQTKGVELLKQDGMEVVADVDTTRFAAAMASAAPIFEKHFGAETIGKIRDHK
jgi:tripartite ATP-independent transporter DctP family solute receptor